MSANLIVDLGQTAQLGYSLGSGTAFAASGGTIGLTVDMLNSDTFCNLFVGGVPQFTSGQLRIQVQTSDTNTSGNFTDPTSGLAQLPTVFSSGGLIILNSGATTGGLFNGAVSGQHMQSGFMVAAGFQRPHRFVRANIVSGDFYVGSLVAGFISQFKTTGSGGGSTQSPGSGTVTV